MSIAAAQGDVTTRHDPLGGLRHLAAGCRDPRSSSIHSHETPVVLPTLRLNR